MSDLTAAARRLRDLFGIGTDDRYEPPRVPRCKLCGSRRSADKPACDACIEGGKVCPKCGELKAAGFDLCGACSAGLMLGGQDEEEKAP